MAAQTVPPSMEMIPKESGNDSGLNLVRLTKNKLRQPTPAGIEPDQTAPFFMLSAGDLRRPQPDTAASLASASSLPSAARVRSMPGLAVLPVSAARNGCAT